VKAGGRVSVISLDDASFLEELRARGADVVVNRRRVGSDVLFWAVEDRRALSRLRTHRQFVSPRGALWVVWPKGSRDVNENDVREAALDAGLVDVKVVSFSDVLSALKLVTRLADRPA